MKSLLGFDSPQQQQYTNTHKMMKKHNAEQQHKKSAWKDGTRSSLKRSEQP